MITTMSGLPDRAERTFRDGQIDGVHVVDLLRHVDDRGFLVEIFRRDELPDGLHPMMGYLSYTEPGVARGPHEHGRQTDLFAFIGPGNFAVHLWDNRRGGETLDRRMVFYAGVDRPRAVIVPPGVVHAYRNTSRTERGMVLNFPDQLYAGAGRNEAVDEIRHEKRLDAFYTDFIHGARGQ